jgi:hypothetical protein
MTLQIDFWQFVLALCALAGVMAGMIWSFSRVVISTIDQRFARLDDDLRKLEEAAHENEKGLLRLRADLPNEYVRREDWIRFSGVIDSKLDALSTKLDALRERSNGGI